MKDLYNINKWSVITAILLCFTFWGIIIALPILGLIQIIMSIKIIINFNKLLKRDKILFIEYLIITVLFVTGYIMAQNNSKLGLELMFAWVFVSLGLATFHLYITYKIRNYEPSNS